MLVPPSSCQQPLPLSNIPPAPQQASTLADAVFPAVCKTIATAIFNKRDPIVLGIDVLEGKLKIGTPMCVVLPPDSNVAAAKSSTMVGDTGVAITTGPTVLDIGRVTGIEINHAAQTEACAGGPSVCVKISPGDGQAAVMFGRQFDETYLLYSHVSRKSIEVLKEHFKDQMTKADWKTVIKLKVGQGGGSFSLPHRLTRYPYVFLAPCPRLALVTPCRPS